MMQGSEWPVPVAERQAETVRERLARVAPAVVVALALHGVAAWWLLRPPPPWRHAPTTMGRTDAIEIEFYTPAAPPTAATPVVEIDAVPFVVARPSVVEAELRFREPTPAAATALPPPGVSGAELYDDIAGVAADMAGAAASPARRSAAELPGRDEPFIDAELQFRKPPPSLQQRTQAVIGLLLRTSGSNSVTDFMGATEGRDPGREIQRAHHHELYLPRDCDNPEKQNLSDECMGVPRG
jgi:hypothetical protein